jgi:hypothetical protein
MRENSRRTYLRDWLEIFAMSGASPIGKKRVAASTLCSQRISTVSTRLPVASSIPISPAIGKSRNNQHTRAIRHATRHSTSELRSNLAASMPAATTASRVKIMTATMPATTQSAIARCYNNLTFVHVAGLTRLLFCSWSRNPVLLLVEGQNSLTGLTKQASGVVCAAGLFVHGR